jgi:hypothetical protein
MKTKTVVKRRTLQTWGGRSQFQYEGSVNQGTVIHCGKKLPLRRYEFPKELYAGMLAEFSSQEVSIGTSPVDPPPGSLGEWLDKTYGWYGMTSYIGPILLKEGKAERGAQPDRIRFKSN